jgi:hypothetical protein
VAAEREAALVAEQTEYLGVLVTPEVKDEIMTAVAEQSARGYGEVVRRVLEKWADQRITRRQRQSAS